MHDQSKIDRRLEMLRKHYEDTRERITISQAHRFCRDHDLLIPEWIKQPMFDEFIEILRKDYEKTANPVFVWHAYRFCRDEGLNTPEWVEQYLDKVSTNIVNADPSPKDIPHVIAKALGFTGRGGPGAFRWRDYVRRRKTIHHIDLMRETFPELSIKKICRHLSIRTGIPWSTIERWYQRR